MLHYQDLVRVKCAIQLTHSNKAYYVGPNPCVACAIWENEALLGDGITQIAGFDHAEVQAVKAALANPASGGTLAGATAYVTLEPCSHHGRTPPCADLLIKHKFARVVVAVRDPNPQVNGGGIARLRAAGIEVDVLDITAQNEEGRIARAARELNIGFFSRMQRGRPWVRLKVAASLDGITALASGESQWITSEVARADGHHFRARSCAVLTGVGTLKADDPQLNVRLVETPRQPRKILVDSLLDAPLTAKLFQQGTVWIFCGAADAQKAKAFQAAGHDVIALPDANGKVDLAAMMNELGKREINELHVEAGYKLNGSLLKAGVVDELLLYLAPKLLGQGMGVAQIGPLAELSQAETLQIHSADKVGDDLRIICRTKQSIF
jgi:diaminohydroxyphosphoribosylaminopyrimidine deaminase / 5-amino-6-(5-phosphoribosylamino)uracil reductase